MKQNSMVVVIRNRDKNQPGTYRVRDLVTGKMSYTDDITLTNVQYLPNIDGMAALEPEQVIHCNWAFAGIVADRISKKTGKTQIETEMYGFTINNRFYYEEDHGKINALSFKGNNRFIWLDKPVEQTA
jgi:hypothetical protein